MALGGWSEKAENIAEEMQGKSKTQGEYGCRSHQLCRDGIILIEGDRRQKRC